MTGVRFLAWELLHAMSMAKKKKRKRNCGSSEWKFAINVKYPLNFKNLVQKKAKKKNPFNNFNMLKLRYIKLNDFTCFFLIFNVVTRKCKTAYVARLVFLVDSMSLTAELSSGGFLRRNSSGRF